MVFNRANSLPAVILLHSSAARYVILATAMRIWMLPLLAGTLHAATIRGTVVENGTGHALAHVSVVLDPVQGSGGVHMAVHTNQYGLFEFPDAAPGLYLLQASRVPFLTAYYGQKRWNSAGTPLAVTDADAPFLTIKMLRYAAIAGTVVDENDVGQPQFELTAYRSNSPSLQTAAKALADEQGNFRIYGLLPGDYLIRSMGKELERVGYKPTFAHETESADQARLINVQMEQEFRDVKLRALPGQLLSLAVAANPLEPINADVTLVLASEMGRQTAKGPNHTFTGLPSGDYDISAEAPSDSPPLLQGAYQRITIAKDSSVQLTLRKVDPMSFYFDSIPGQLVDNGTVKVLGRHKDLAGPQETQEIKLVDRKALLSVGPWEFAIAPMDGYYVSGFYGSGSAGFRSRKHADGWNEATVNPRPMSSSARFSFSPGHAAVHGTVTDAGAPVAGAPVFIEAVDIEPERRIADCFVAITDVQGRYRFSGLAPGRYRLLSSFEYQMPDSQTMTDASAKDVLIGAHADHAFDLDLYVIR
jgi:Carboxypeptidase regulatory-like domain